MAQKACIEGFEMYQRKYAIVVKCDPEYKDEKIHGWILTTKEDEKDLWKEKLKYFDGIESYYEECPEDSFYFRMATVGKLKKRDEDDEHTLIGNEGELVNVFIYHRNLEEGMKKIEGDDWLARNRNLEDDDEKCTIF